MALTIGGTHTRSDRRCYRPNMDSVALARRALLLMRDSFLSNFLPHYAEQILMGARAQLR